MKPKIVCTIGPATKTRAIQTELVKAGLAVARFNFSHGSAEEFTRWATNLRSISRRLGKPVEIMQDLQGPRVRVGNIPKRGRHLLAGQKVRVVYGETRPSRRNLILAAGGMTIDLKAGEKILLSDGEIELEVISANAGVAEAKVISGGYVFPGKGANLPQVDFGEKFTDKDQRDLKWGIEHKVDSIAVSFVDSAADLEPYRQAIGGNSIKIIAKIERRAALEKIDEILKASDGIIVARGDLGIETELTELPFVQKALIKKAKTLGKPVYVATQMLWSMAFNPRPSRAEVADVANATLDGADYLVLSDETAVGKYPLKAVEIMAGVIRAAEKHQ